MSRLDWTPILARAADIVDEYSIGVTLRQLFYRLVSEGLIPNRQSVYIQLSRLSAEARRAGWFPTLIEAGRSIHRYQTWADPEDARNWLRNAYRIDRSRTQPTQVWLGVEKAGLVEVLLQAFGDLGLPIIALSGYSSQTYVDDIVGEVTDDGRPAMLVYAGDFDPSGTDILDDFISRTGCWADVDHIGLTHDQVLDRNLPVMPGKASDPRAGTFVSQYGSLMQVELDALPPDDLTGLYQQAIDKHWDTSAYDAALAQEQADLDELE